MTPEWKEWVKTTSLRQLLTSIGVREQLIIMSQDAAEKELFTEERKILIAEVKSRPEYPDNFLAETADNG